MFISWMFMRPSFKKSLIVEQFQGNYLNKTNHATRWTVIYPVDSAIPFPKSRGPNIPGSRAPRNQPPPPPHPLGPWKMPLSSHASSCTGLVGLTRIPAILPVSLYASLLISLSARFVWTKHGRRQASRFYHCFPLLPTARPQRSRPAVSARPTPSSCGFCSHLGCSYPVTVLVVHDAGALPFWRWREGSRNNYFFAQ